MRLPSLILLVITSCLISTALAETEEPMLVCTRTDLLYSSPCASLPGFLSKPRALPSRLPGVAILSLVIEKDGSTGDVHVIKSDGIELGEGAVAEVKTWRFAPAKYEEKPVAVEMLLQLTFSNSGPAIQIGALPSTSAQKQRVQQLFLEAKQAYRLQDFQTSASLARRILSLASQCKEARLLLGLSLLQLEEPDEARAAIEDEIKLDPTSPLAYSALGHVFMNQRLFDEAIAQFQKQITINPKDFDSHQQIAAALRHEKKCREAIPELEKALAIAPTSAETLVAHGDCMIELGDTAKGISEMEQASSLSPEASTWNSTAYNLAQRSVQLDLAQKWAETALTIQSAHMLNLSLDHLSARQLKTTLSFAAYWDTLGWVFYKKGDFEKARQYLEPAWSLAPAIVIGTHLGQTYEQLNRKQDAARTYAMVLATIDRDHIPNIRPEDTEDASNGLKKLARPDQSIPALVKQGRIDLDAMGSTTLLNSAHENGDADFTFKIASSGISEVRRVTGNAQFDKFIEPIRAIRPLMQVPGPTGIELPRRGTLSCSLDESNCRFVVLRAKEVWKLASKEEIPMPIESQAVPPQK